MLAEVKQMSDRIAELEAACRDSMDLLEDMVSEFEYTKAEYTERAFRFYAKHVRAGTADE